MQAKTLLRAAAFTSAGVAALAIATSSCSRSPRETTAVDHEPAEADTAPAEPPGMFDAVPADTPYLMATLDPWPEAYEAFARDPIAEADDLFALAGELEFEGAPAFQRLQGAVEDLVAERGAEAIGVEPGGRAVVYGLGLLPVVRTELADPDALVSAIGALETEEDLELPAREIAGHEVWWFAGPGDRVVAAAVLGGDLALAFGPKEAVRAGFDVLVGARELSEVVSEETIRERAEEAGFLDGFFSELDAIALARLATGGGAEIPAEIAAAMAPSATAADASCREAALQAARRAPGFAFGYKALESDHFEAEVALRLDDELAAALSRAQTAAAGVAMPEADDPPLFAAGGAADIEAGAGALELLGAEVKELGEACDHRGLREGGREMAQIGASPIPPPAASLRGALVVLEELDLAAMSGEGYAIAAVDDPAALAEALAPFIPELEELGEADGAFRELPDELAAVSPIDLDLAYAMTEDAFALAVGEDGRTSAKSALERRPDRSPFFGMGLDYARLAALGEAVVPGAAAEDEAAEAFAALEALPLGWGRMSIHAAEEGLRARIAGELENDETP